MIHQITPSSLPVLPGSTEPGAVAGRARSDTCGASVGFHTRYDRELREPLVWRQGPLSHTMMLILP